MNRVEAARLLDLPLRASSESIEAAFRRHARRTHPDTGGTAAAFDQLVEARRLLASPTAGGAPVVGATRASIRARRWHRTRQRLLRRLSRNPGTRRKEH